jgi:ATP-dependent helicase/nuclease subunit B
VFHAAQVEHTAGPRISQSEFQHLAFRTNAEPLTQHIEPRINRHLQPIYSVTVNADEPAFDGALSLNDVVGGPIRPHELDLFAQCGLKFYFYQLLLNFDGNHIDRDTIPPRLEDAPTSRFGELPAVVASQQADEGYRDEMARIITELRPDRQADLDEFESIAELRDWFMDLEDVSQGVLQALISEWQQVQLEQEYGVDRDWEWIDDPEPVTLSGTDVELSAHRVDSLLDRSLPVFLARERQYAERALKQCWVENGDPRRIEQCEGLCEGCGRGEDCSYTTKFTLDHRLHTTVAYSDNTLGLLLQEQGESRPAARQGHIIDPERELSGPEGEIEPYLERWAAERYDTVAAQWRSDIEHHVRQMRPDPSVEFSTTREFTVDLDGCENCVYRELCQVPLQEGRR